MKIRIIDKCGDEATVPHGIPLNTELEVLEIFDDRGEKDVLVKYNEEKIAVFEDEYEIVEEE